MQIRLNQLIIALVAACMGASAQPLLWFPVQRTISAESDFRVNADPLPVQQAAAGPASGPWNGALFVPNHYDFFSMDLSVGQASTPTATGLTCQLFSVFEFFAPDEIDVTLIAESQLRSYFAVTAPVDVTIFAELSASVDAQFANVFPAEYQAAARLELRRVGDQELLTQTVIANLAFWDENQVQVYLTQPLAWTANLPLGIYEISISTAAMSDNVFERLLALEPGRCEAALSLTLTTAESPPPPPCGGDLDGDGDADILDFALFQQCFSGPRP